MEEHFIQTNLHENNQNDQSNWWTYQHTTKMKKNGQLHTVEFSATYQLTDALFSMIREQWPIQLEM